MCGIAICLSRDQELLSRFKNSSMKELAHRGPDDRGSWMDDHATLVHTRLSILDLSEAGHQPMVSQSGRYIITYNGEIYNHQELRSRFLLGVQFRGHSDTETLLALYEKLGHGMLTHLVGMWALGIWDTKEKKLFLSRDRFGQKPLYWVDLGKRQWIFASEQKALLPFVSERTLNHTAAVEYLSLGNYGHLGVDTFINEVKEFPPAHFAYVYPTSEPFTPSCYWKIPWVFPSDKIGFDDSVSKQLNGLIREAVLSQTLSDVQIGMTLSGGIDSSVLAGVLANHSEKAIEVFTARNEDNPRDESGYATTVITHWRDRQRLHLNLIDMGSLSVQHDLERTLQVQEEPFGDPSIISHLKIMRSAQEKGIKVILGGQGADEIFYGYDNMFHALAGGTLRKGDLLKFAGQVRQLRLSSGDISKILLSALAPHLYVHFRRRSRKHRRNFIRSEFLYGVVDQKIHLARPDDFYETWIESIRGVHLPHLVHYDDRNGMALGVEGRMPFLDHRILEFLAAIRTEDFARDGVRKFLLKESCSSYLPPSIRIRQDKVGFFTPLREMIFRDLDFLHDQFRSLVFPLQIVDARVLQTDLERCRKGELDMTIALRIWRTFSLCLWMKLFNVKVTGRF